MSVVKGKRKPSQFEVFHHLNKLRKDITDLLLRDFGYNAVKAEKRMEKRFGGRPYEELTDIEKQQYERQKKRYDAFDEWFIKNERDTIIDCLRSIGEHVYTANSIYPNYPEELVERRLHQDLAIGQCYRLVQELQYAIEIVLGTYPRRGETAGSEIFLPGQEDFTERNRVKFADMPHGRFAAKGGGMGCAFIRRVAFEIVPYPWFRYVEYDNGDVLSEDNYFCCKATAAGLPIQADGRVRCGHISTWTARSK